MSERCFIALSGGVDSAVCAALLKNKGYELIGVTLRLKPDSLADDDIKHAENICKDLSIPFETVDMTQSFRNIVRDYFVDEYRNGRTPNPCVLCNPLVKFAGMMDFADKNGGGFIASGHYVLNEKSPDGLYRLKMSPTGKDQSYFLYMLDQKMLSRLLFPLGRMTKAEVRQTAEELGLSVAKRRDSLEVCFIPDNDYIGYIEGYGKKLPPKGNFLDTEGRIIGKHSGIYKYTIGQRKGLGAFGEPKYAVKINAGDNTVVLGADKDLYTDEIIAENMSWISGKEPASCFKADIKIRCTAKPAAAEITLLGGRRAKIVFEKKQRAAAPGQAAVMYDDTVLLGGGTITSA